MFFISKYLIYTPCLYMLYVYSQVCINVSQMKMHYHERNVRSPYPKLKKKKKKKKLLRFQVKVTCSIMVLSMGDHPGTMAPQDYNAAHTLLSPSDCIEQLMIHVSVVMQCQHSYKWSANYYVQYKAPGNKQQCFQLLYLPRYTVESLS